MVEETGYGVVDLLDGFGVVFVRLEKVAELPEDHTTVG